MFEEGLKFPFWKVKKMLTNMHIEVASLEIV